MEKSIIVPINTKYHTLNELTDKTLQVWFLLHGYGQLAEFFIKKFNMIDNETNYLIAPQGLNKFYLEGFGGRVGANWMTKEDRLNEIANYVTYLNHVYQDELRDIDLQKVKINILAFSQGCATASRWVAYSKIKCDRLILWAGEIPQDVVEDEVFKTTPLTLIFGTEDELITYEMKQTFFERIYSVNLHPQVINYKGKHEIDSEVFRTLIAQSS
jgi:predicted esterase